MKLAPAGRPPRGRPALVQPPDARGAQPRAHRPRRRPAAGAHADGDGPPRRRGPGEPEPARRRRHDRRLPRRRRGGSAPRAHPPVSSPDSTARPYLVSTVHRAENTDDPERLGAVDRARWPACRRPVLLLAHPRLRGTPRGARHPARGRVAAGGTAAAATPNRRGRCWARPAWSPTPAACRRRRSCWAAVHHAAHRDRVARNARPRLERARPDPGPARRGRVAARSRRPAGRALRRRPRRRSGREGTRRRLSPRPRGRRQEPGRSRASYAGHVARAS